MGGTRRLLLASAVLVWLTACTDAPAPNILFIYADDWGWGDLGAHDHSRIETPNLDRLAREGTDFHHFTVASPLCSPSRVALLTGQFPARHGINHTISGVLRNRARDMPDWLDPDVPMLPRALQQAGYRTAHYGKWHLSSSSVLDDAPHPSEYGYDDAASWSGPARDILDGTSMEAMVPPGSGSIDPIRASYLSAAAVEHTLRFIRDGGDAPFYVNLWLHETHTPVTATDEDRSAYPDTPEPQRTYYAAVTRADRQVGRVLSLLEELGKVDDTIVIFSSDNGPAKASPRPEDSGWYSVGSTGGRRGGKRSLYLGGVGAPFIVRWPGRVPAGRVDRTSPISAVDVFPTLLAAAEIPLPPGYQPDGVNVLPLWLGESQTRDKPLFWWRPQGSRNPDDWAALAMQQGPWMLLTDEAGERRELYDVIQDPEQRGDLAARQPGRAESMAAAVLAWQAGLSPPSPAANRTAIDLVARQIKEFNKADTNGDDKVSFEEFLARQPNETLARLRFERFDRNGDGTLSRREYIEPAADSR